MAKLILILLVAVVLMTMAVGCDYGPYEPLFTSPLPNPTPTPTTRVFKYECKYNLCMFWWED